MNRKERRRAVKEAGKAGAVPAPGGVRTSAAPLGAAALVAQATRLHQMSRLAEAAALYRQALALDPADPDAIHLLGLVAHQTGDNATAIGLLEKAIAIDGSSASYHSNLGEAYRALGRLEDAVRCHRRALAIRPDMADARFGLGTALLDMKSYAEAASELAAAVRLRPDDADARLNLGIALFEAGRAKEAIAQYEAARHLKPDFAEVHLNLGIVRRVTGEERAAYAALARAIELAPGIAEAHYQIGWVLANLERFDDAALALAEATRRGPEMAAAHLKLGEVLRLLHRTEEAIAAYERAAVLQPALPEALLGIGLAHLEAGDFDAARRKLAAALALAPDSADAHFDMGLSYQLQGRFEEAVGWHEKAITLKPDHASAHYHLATDRKSGPSPVRRREIERVLALPTLSDEQRSSLNFALAKIHDDAGDYDAAFHAYKTANDLKASKLSFRPEDFTAYMDRLVAVFDAALFAEKAGLGSASELPVYIVGMPRSGTTLVEQILASHPEVFGAGELDYMRQIVHALAARLEAGGKYPECLRALDGATARAITDEHLASLAAHAPTASRIIDKLPNNFARLGLIALLFPRARLLHCVRDPLDTCLSCYFQEFAHGQPFTWSLEHLGRYYRDYARLMAHWRAVLPSVILDVPYEALVADQEGWSRRLVDFLGLAWDERCLAFYEKERLVRTASLWQVRQPIYASSVGRWRHYAKHLGPLFAALGMTPPNG
ncbi:MAG: tetratricopeptide repeat protein [Alphaproteobacteria bacterium]